MRAKYCLGAQGSSAFIRPAANAQSDVLEPFFGAEEWEYAPEYFAQLPALYMNRKPQALGGFEVFGVALGFLGTCFAKKIFDEVYERTLKRPIGAYLDRFFQCANIPAGKAVEYRDIIYFEDIDLVVVIRVIATSEATAELQTQVMHAHRIAHAFIETHGRRAPVHCHEVIGGQVMAQAEFFQNVEEINQHDRTKLKVRWRKRI